MLIKMVSGATRILGKSQGYLGLPVRDELIIDNATGLETNRMVTAWEPSPKELEALQKGAPVYLKVLGTMHPPVMIEVGEIPSVLDPT